MTRADFRAAIRTPRARHSLAVPKIPYHVVRPKRDSASTRYAGVVFASCVEELHVVDTISSSPALLFAARTVQARA